MTRPIPVSPITKSEELVQGTGKLPVLRPEVVDPDAAGTAMDTTGKTVDTEMPDVTVAQATPSADVPVPTALTDDTGQIKEITKQHILYQNGPKIEKIKFYIKKLPLKNIKKSYGETYQIYL